MANDTQQLIITLRPDGGVEAETVGITGSACLDYIARLEDLLDAETAESAFTSDYTAAQHQQSSTAAQQWSGAER